MFTVKVFTIYPDLFPGPFTRGLFGKALENKIWDFEKINIRDYTIDKHKTVDDTPYGGGSGMLIKPDVIASALDKNTSISDKTIFLTPRGKTFNQKLAKKLSK